MARPLFLRDLTEEEATTLRALAHRQTAEARVRDRARWCWRSHEGDTVPTIARATQTNPKTVRRWIVAFNAQGIAGLDDAARPGRPPTYTAEQVGTVVATSLTDPTTLGLPFGCWTLDRLAAYLAETHGIAMKRSRIGQLLRAEGLRWRTQETWFGARVDPDFAGKRGRLSRSTPIPRSIAS